MHKSATKCNETLSKWCKNKHGASKIVDTLETYHHATAKTTKHTIKTTSSKHGASKIIDTVETYQSFRSAAWSSRRSLDLTRSVSRCVTGFRCRPGRGGFSGTRMLVHRWWICCSSPTLSMGVGRSWSKTARGRLPVDVPQRHVPCCVQRACSSTHKVSLAMVLSWISQWWRLGVPSDVRLDGVGVGQRPLALAVARNHRIDFYFSIFYNFICKVFKIIILS
jgi:hypothetical protein